MEIKKMKKNEYLLSVTEVRKILKEQSREELVELLVDSYKTIPQLKEYITAKYANVDKIEQIFEVYKNKIHDVFFPERMSAQFKIGDARKAVNNFKKLCSDEKLIIKLMLYYVEMGVEFTNAYGDIDESFYNSIENMYQSLVKSANKQKDSEIFNIFKYRLKAVVDDTRGIGWGFHDELSCMYNEIKWLALEDIDFDENELKEIKEYISSRLEKRNDLPSFDKNVGVNEVISEIIEADEIFLSKMEAQGIGYSNDDEYDFIEDKTGYSAELIEFILWQRYAMRWKMIIGNMIKENAVNVEILSYILRKFLMWILQIKLYVKSVVLNL